MSAMDVGAVKAPMIRRSSLVQPFLDEIDFAFELWWGMDAREAWRCRARYAHKPGFITLLLR
jgi:hypothetical protein